jgi:hypothetical protein
VAPIRYPALAVCVEPGRRRASPCGAESRPISDREPAETATAGKLEAAYRRGVQQALAFALSSISPDQLADAVDEAGRMRCDGEDHPAFLDELIERLRRRMGAEK